MAQLSDPRPEVPAGYTAPIEGALIRCQRCNRAIGVTSDPATAPEVTCANCIHHAVGVLLDREPPF